MINSQKQNRRAGTRALPEVVLFLCCPISNAAMHKETEAQSQLSLQMSGNSFTWFS